MENTQLPLSSHPFLTMLAAGHLLYGHSASRGVGLDDTESRVVSVATFDWIFAQAVGNTRTAGEVDMNLVGARGDLIDTLMNLSSQKACCRNPAL